METPSKDLQPERSAANMQRIFRSALVSPMTASRLCVIEATLDAARAPLLLHGQSPLGKAARG